MDTKDFYLAFNRSAGLLQRIASKLTDNMDDARALYQETAFRALKYRNTLNPGDSFGNWATIIMGNVFLARADNDKKRTVMRKPDGRAGKSSGATAILQLVESLEEKYRIPFWNHYMGMTPAEISEHTGLPEAVVKERIQMAQQQLKSKLRA